MVKAIAIHLPQFHPFPENDKWWGKGFTEWTNVTKATPRFDGHYQPHLPTDSGFYDLRLEQARMAQAEMAKEYMIHGFCYYHYWFNGKRLMHQPLDEILKSQKPDFPFMLCWANENWTRRWDGLDTEVLIKQDYSEQDDVDHITFLCENVFSDPRYIKVDGKPFFVIYRPALFPDIRKTLSTWRLIAKRLGFKDLYVGYMQSFAFKEEPKAFDFDCAIEFQPDFSALPSRISASLYHRVKRKIFNSKPVPYQRDRIFSYKTYVEQLTKNKQVLKDVYPGITPMWDNSARRNTDATIFIDSHPALYKKWLQHIVDQYRDDDIKTDDKFIFINAWNEWAEGNHIEPCIKWGRAYLEATKQVLENA